MEGPLLQQRHPNHQVQDHESGWDVVCSQLLLRCVTLSHSWVGAIALPTGTHQSRDRSEPYIGAKVVLEIYKKYKDRWLLDLLYDDLLAWNSWIWLHRREPPANLVVLGSDPNPPTHGDASINVMQGARFESGLDNSPMYDGEFFNNVTHHMMLWDVGMTGMYLMECLCLAEIAAVLGRTETRRCCGHDTKLQQPRPKRTCGIRDWVFLSTSAVIRVNFMSASRPRRSFLCSAELRQRLRSTR